MPFPNRFQFLPFAVLRRGCPRKELRKSGGRRVFFGKRAEKALLFQADGGILSVRFHEIKPEEVQMGESFEAKLIAASSREVFKKAKQILHAGQRNA